MATIIRPIERLEGFTGPTGPPGSGGPTGPAGTGSTGPTGPMGPTGSASIVTGPTGTAGTSTAMPPGAMTAYAAATAPTGWLLCDGASYLRTDYAALFAAIGTTFGSADGTHFNVPDGRGRMAMGVDGAAGRITVAADTLGDSGGAERVTLTSGESGVPVHIHATGITAFTSSGSQAAGGTRANAVASNNPNTGVNTAADAVDAHQNLPPYLVVQWIIKT